MKITATVQVPWHTVIERLFRTLREKGFEVRRTFDLQMARKLLKTGAAPPCPHHGTPICDCQYLVLRISGSDRHAMTLVIHGHDRVTTISYLAGGGEEAKRDMADAMYGALEHLRAVGRAKPQTPEQQAIQPKTRPKTPEPENRRTESA